MIKPIMKITHQNVMDILRPILSAIGAATRAPTRVPIESWTYLLARRGNTEIDILTVATIRPERTLEKYNFPVL